MTAPRVSKLGRAAAVAALLAVAACALAASRAQAAEGSRVVSSPLEAFAHNQSSDGRLFITGSRAAGWQAWIFRPERVRLDGSGLPDLSKAFSEPVVIQPPEHNELALAICEPDPARAPYRCDAGGEPAEDGAFACYDVWLFDSDQDAFPHELRRRRLRLQVSDPDTRDARVASFEWPGTREPLSPPLRGLEPTVTRDGRLLVWQGKRENTGRIDTIVYSYNDTPCAAEGWSEPRDLSRMHEEARLRERYRLAAEPLRAPDGTVYEDRIHGAYPWLFPDGEALLMTATGFECEAPRDPPGCGLRRSTLSVLGYSTNWGLAPIDGEVNPSTVDQQRLFFTATEPELLPTLPVTDGLDVWPVFGSTTASYTELVLDDGLDGRYGGVWHMNDNVGVDGELDPTRTPDTSGYFNTGRLLGGARLPDRNGGVIGKAVTLEGAGGRVEVAHATSLSPVNNLTVELFVRPAAAPDCDDGDNWRVLLAKGDPRRGAYSLVLEDDGTVSGQVRTGGGSRRVRSPAALPAERWTHLALTWAGEAGELSLFVDGERAVRRVFGPATLDGSDAPLSIGGMEAAASCPTGGGSFAGRIDEVKISSVVRYGEGRPAPRGLEAAEREGSGGGCAVAGRGPATPAWACAALLLGWLGRRRALTALGRRAGSRGR